MSDQVCGARSADEKSPTTGAPEPMGVHPHDDLYGPRHCRHKSVRSPDVSDPRARTAPTIARDLGCGKSLFKGRVRRRHGRPGCEARSHPDLHQPHRHPRQLRLTHALTRSLRYERRPAGALTPAFSTIGGGIEPLRHPIMTVAPGNTTPDAGSASGSISSIQQPSSGLGSAAIISAPFDAKFTLDTGPDNSRRASWTTAGQGRVRVR
jgi:hypothetical protein